MITWMQRHRKYLIITLWISGGAFIAAGPMFAIGSGSFSGRSADTVAKVGEIEISVHQLNNAYSQLFARYNQMLQGKLDKEQAKAFGLEKQALAQLTDEALFLNLAKEFNLDVLDTEISNNLRKTPAFQKDGSFDKETYIKVLKQSRLTPKVYEEDVKRRLLLNKIINIISPKTLPIENDVLTTALNINDKISYKVLDTSMIEVDVKEDSLKDYWSLNKMAYLNEPSFELEIIEHKNVSGEYSEEELKTTYEKNKHDYKNREGVIKSFEEAKTDIIKTLNDKETKNLALRTYLDFKKGKLKDDVLVKKMTISESKNPFGMKILEKISKLNPTKPYLKAEKVNGNYLTIKLVKPNPSKPKTFEEAKSKAEADYIKEQKTIQLKELAKNSVATFNGKVSSFLTRESINKLSPLDEYEAGEFLTALFDKQEKRGFIELANEKIVLFNILEQKLLEQKNTTQERNVLRLKTSLLNDGLLKKLKAQYPVTSYLEGR